MSTKLKILLCAILLAGAVFLMPRDSRSDVAATSSYRPSATILDHKPENFPTAVFAGGCFWCVESEFRRIQGVLFTESGYAGGTVENPTYQQVSAHDTGHREAVAVTFDPAQLSYRDLSDFFMTRAHDPTQADGQGPDIGFQYTSAIFYNDDAQKETTEALLASYEKNHTFKKPVATKLLPFSNFYPAEDYHQQYYEKSEAKTGSLPMNLWLRQQQENAGRLFGK